MPWGQERSLASSRDAAMTSSERSAQLLLAGLALVLVTPVATWFVGAFLIPMEFIEDPDYKIRPLKVNPVLEVGVGVTALFIAGASAGVLAVGKHRYDLRWWSVGGPLVAAGAVCGGGWSMITAPVIGANIGGAMAVMFGTPAVVVLVVVAAVNGLRMRRSGSR